MLQRCHDDVWEDELREFRNKNVRPIGTGIVQVLVPIGRILSFDLA
jgi:hypothetical protein